MLNNKNFFFKKFKISKSLKLEYFILKNQKFLIVSNAYKYSYFIIPEYISFILLNNILFFLVKALNKKLLFSFFFNFKFLLKQLLNTYYKIIYVRGVGYKIVNLNNILKLKLGYSHFIYLTIPNNIIIKFLKKN